MPVLHNFVNPIADEPGFLGTKPSDWNDHHSVDIVDADVNPAAGIVESKLSLNFPTHAPVTLGLGNGLSLSGQQLSMGLAGANSTGTLSAQDWNTFNGKQSALSFPLLASLGGTGISNTGTFTNHSNTIIIGGGTLSLGGFTLTVPDTGTIALGTGVSTQLVYWNDANTLSTIAKATYANGIITIVGTAYDAGLRVKVFNSGGSAIEVYDGLGARRGSIVAWNGSYFQLTAVSALKLVTGAGSYVEVSDDLRVLANFQVNSSIKLGLFAYATAGNPLTTSPGSVTWAWGWNGTNGSTEVVTSNWFLTKDDHTSGHGTVKLAIAASPGAFTPVVFSIDYLGNLGIYDGGNLILGTTTGTKIGTATGQKLGFWNATPVVQQVLATGGGATVDNVISLLQTLGLCKQS